MKIRFNCPHCSKSMRVDQAHAGKTLPCPLCRKKLVIPEGPFDENGEPVAGNEVVPAVELPAPRFVPATPDPDDPMLELFPDFIPNPFGESYPLNKTHTEEGVVSVEEEELPPNSNMPSVDELIS